MAAATVGGVNCKAGLGEWRDTGCDLPRGGSKNAVFRKAAQRLPRLSLHAVQREHVWGHGRQCLPCPDSGMSQEQVPIDEVEWTAQHAEFDVRMGQSVAHVRASQWDGTRVSEGHEGEREVETIRVERTSCHEERRGTEVPAPCTEYRLVYDKDAVHLEVEVEVNGIDSPSCRNRQKLERSYSSMTRQPERRPDVAPEWRDVQGADDWKGMLEPEMHSTLRSELVRYGEFSQACYDAFDGDTTSRYCGSCLFDQDKLLESVGLPDTGYVITKYIYATSQDLHLPNFFTRPDVKDKAWSKDSNWVGFVAVCMSKSEIRRLGRRDVLVAWRGTCTNFEWKENMRDYLAPMQSSPSSKSPPSMQLRGPITGKEIPGPLKVDVKVEKGFYHMYSSSNPNTRYNKHSAKKQVLDEVKRLVTRYNNEHLSITVTGHSLGGALSILCAHDICEQRINRYTYKPPPGHDDNILKDKLEIPVTVFNFAAPRVGNEAFRHRLEKELGVKVLRVVNAKDTVPKFPGYFVNEKRFPFLLAFFNWLPWTYSHVGVELELNSDHSDCLDHDKCDLAANHNMELYLHLVEAFKSRLQPFANFNPLTCRDLALLNRSSDVLDKRFRVPPCWWQPENKGLKFNKVRQRWMRPGRDDEDVPVIVDRYPSKNRDADDIPVNIDRHHRTRH